MPACETSVKRRERLLRNSLKRGPLNRRIHNNRKGQPFRWQRQQQAASAHYNRMVKLGYL